MNSHRRSQKNKQNLAPTPPRADPQAQTGQESNETDEQDGGKEFVTKSYMADMLKVQESMFRSLFDSMLANITSRVDNLATTISGLKSSLEFTQGEVDDLKNTNVHAKRVEEELGAIQDQIDYHRGKMEYLENQSRRNNIRISGIPEDSEETWDETESKAKEALRSRLKLTFEVNVERAHRTGKRQNRSGNSAQQTRPRTIVCRLANWKQKDLILRAARKEKPEGFFVNEDLAAETLERRKDQMPKLKQAKQAGKMAYFVLDRLIIKDRPVAS